MPDEIVDISRTREKRRQQLVRRIGVPILGVTLLIVSIFGVSIYTYETNRAAALTLSTAVFRELQARIAREVSGYLSPATEAALIVRDMVARHAIPDGRVAIEGYAASMLSQMPHLEAFYAASGRGDFIMVRRDPGGGTDTKLIVNAPGSRSVSSVHLSDTGRLLDNALSPGDDFDPRGRSWYEGALKTKGVFWSSPYVFFTSKQPGITAAIRLLQAGSADRVFGVDITLEALSSFLASLRIARTGRAAILDRDGTVIASSAPARLASAERRSAAHATVASLGDAALLAAYDRYRIEGYGNRAITVGPSRYVTIASGLPAAGQDWVLLIAAPEADLTALAQLNGRQNFLFSLVTVALAAILGGLLIRQGVRSDRLARMLARQREAGTRENEAFSALATSPDVLDPAQPAPVLTEALAELGGARRTSIWRFAGERRTLRCEDQFEPQHNFHAGGLELSRSELPSFFAALDTGETIELADAAKDPRTTELHRLLMGPFGTQALSVLPVRGASGISGAVLIEDARTAAAVRNLARAVSGIVAMRLGRHEAAPAEAADQPHSGPAEAPAPAAEGDQAFSSDLGSAAIEPSEAERFPAVAAMIIRFDEATTRNALDQGGLAVLADEIARAIQAVARRFALPYLKLTGHHFVAAAGCTASPDPQACLRLADAGLAIREACLSLLERAELDPVFRIGLDFGPALGSILGEAPRLFNLWGEVIRNADLMAHSAPEPGTIQVSESAFAQLRQEFLFRPRGVFFLPRIGTARTFILAGRR